MLLEACDSRPLATDLWRYDGGEGMLGIHLVRSRDSPDHRSEQKFN